MTDYLLLHTLCIVKAKKHLKEWDQLLGVQILKILRTFETNKEAEYRFR